MFNNLKEGYMKKYILTAAFAVALTGAAQAESLNIVSWGGAYTVSQDEAYHKPWTKKTGVKINNIDKSNNGPAGLRAQVAAGNVTWDLVDVIEYASAQLCDEGLVEKIDYDKILAKGVDGSKPSKDFIGGLNGCFIPTIVYSTVFAYNTKAFSGKKPSSVKDFFNLKKFPGRRALEKRPNNNLEWALLADGVAQDDVYDMLETEAGVKRAFRKLDTIKSSIVWWSAGAQPPQLLADKEVSMATGYNGRFFAAQVNEKQPINIIWDAQAFEYDGWVVPKGKLNKVKDYLHFATDSQRLADQAGWISYGPARKSSAALVGKHVKTGISMSEHMPTSPENFKTALVINAEFWTDNGQTLTERFNAWLAK
jgi:putative spermidine/putrescine transport system substrate-binding protein